VKKRAVILAGGKGSRLGPYTTVLPKPLLPVGDRAILDIVVRQLAAHGFTELTFAVGYLAHLIRAVFNDGASHGVTIDYHEESEPLGTAGALGTIEGIDETFLAMNGDVLTALDYTELFKAHQTAGNLLTIATHRRVVHTDYGVIREDGRGGPDQEGGRIRGEARDPLHREHGGLRRRAQAARLHRGRRLPRPARPRAAPARLG
jgi:NDP-sugar pyrophosphorylase family protein